ncbi:hypothetical protein A2U01_0046343 [Trifolium medium]|uniref:Uncharacterized protein n=1 Tax=Trifolium medium TaxID=97028 RepID=A0A392QMQ7_9FABA|nr:hypothetical protein [Trifolium medium]
MIMRSSLIFSDPSQTPEPPLFFFVSSSPSPFKQTSDPTPPPIETNPEKQKLRPFSSSLLFLFVFSSSSPIDSALFLCATAWWVVICDGLRLLPVVL